MYENPDEIDAFCKALFDIKKVRVLGAGAFGIAVLTMDTTMQVPKVFKLPKDQKTTEALKVEGKNLQKLEGLMSPNIIRLHKWGRALVQWDGKEEERYYLCLAFGGTSLRSKLGEVQVDFDESGNPLFKGSGKRLPLDEALRMSIDICQGLEHAHGFRDSDVRVLHRDIKPENILIDDDTGVARICDFGISRIVDRSTGITSVAGTLLYMDPECFAGHAGTYSDVYSFGIVMYEMFAGQLPFNDFHSRMQRPAPDPRDFNPEIPEELARIILKTLKRALSERYDKATELLADLRKIQATLNPLPKRYVKQDFAARGRLLCIDTEAGRDSGPTRSASEQVVVHMIETEAPLDDFVKAAAALEQAGHRALVPPLRHFENRPIVGVVYPKPQGRTLSDTYRSLSSGNTAQFGEFCQTMAEVCEAVAAANQAGVVHGFLTPDLISCNGKQVQVHGFGAAPGFKVRAQLPRSAQRTAGNDAGAAGKGEGRSNPSASTPVGKPAAGEAAGGDAHPTSVSADARAFLAAFDAHLYCISPQLLIGERAPTPADDVFSLGAILYRVLTGVAYLPREALEQTVRGESSPHTFNTPRRVNPYITRRLAALTVKALQWNAADRFASASEIGAALKECRFPDDIIATLAQDALQSYEEGDAVNAYELLEKALAADPGNALIHFTRGQIYFHEREYKWALEELQAAADMEPNADVFRELGNCCMSYNAQYAKAAEMYRKALAFGETAALYDLLAKALNAQNKPEEAAKEMAKAIKLEKDESVKKRRSHLLQTWTLGPGSPDNPDTPDEKK